MANKKVENKELFGKGLFGGAVKKNAETLIELLNEIEKKLVEVAKVQVKVIKNNSNTKQVKSIQKVTKAINTLSEAERKTQKIRKDRVRLEDNLKMLRSDRVQDNEQLKILVSQQRKINKDLARETLGLVGAYEKQSKRLNTLRKEYKDLRTENGKDTKETRKLAKEIKRLDKELKETDASVGQFQRNVGDYPATLKSAGDSLIKFAAAGVGVGGVLEGISKSLGANAESSTAFAGVLQGVGDAANVLFSALGGALNDLLDFNFDKIGENFDGLSDDISKAFSAGRKAAEETSNLEAALRPLNIELEKLNGEIDLLSVSAGDATLGFDEIEKNILALNKAEIKRALILKDIAQQEKDIVDQRVAAAQEGAAIIELLNEQNEAALKVQQAQNEINRVSKENAKEFRLVERDRFEKELDFAIDAFDNLKSINERLLTDDKRTLSERSAIFLRTTELADSSFQSQIKLAEDFTGKKLNLDELVLEEDEKIIRKRLAAQNLDEITLTRILEIIRERRTFTQDLADAENDLNDKLVEENELLDDIEITDKAIREGRAKDQQLDNERFLARKKQLEGQIELLEDDSLEELRLKKELNDLLIDEAQRLADEEEKIKEAKKKSDEEAEEKRKELTQATLETINDLVADSFNKQIEGIDRQIQDATNVISRLESKAAESRLSSEESIAFEQKKQAELELKQEKSRQKQLKAQALFTVLETFNRNDNNLAKTATDIALLRTLASTLTGFFHGTDDTGSSGALKDKHGKITGYTHENEMVFTKSQKELMGNKSRKEIIDIVKQAENGGLSLSELTDVDSASYMLSPKSNKPSADAMYLSDRLNRLEGAIKGIELISDTVEMDSLRNILIHTKSTRNGKVVTKSKLHR